MNTNTFIGYGRTLFKALLPCTLMLLCACQAERQQTAEGKSAPSVQASSTSPADTKVTVCAAPRPQVCPQDYNPVCAQRDTGIRCITTPCPSVKAQTYSNGCTACADDKVINYSQGACDPKR